jgi:hypothetical protein
LGRELLQVCFGLYQIILNFDEDTSISLECEFRLTETNTLQQGDQRSDLDSHVIRLLGSRITNVTNKGEGQLLIHFSSGSSLEIFDSNPSHESYHITHGKEMIIV